MAKSRRQVAAWLLRTEAMDSAKLARDAISPAKRCWKNSMGSFKRCQKKLAESDSVIFSCHRVRHQARMKEKSPLNRKHSVMASMRLVIQSLCFPVKISSRKIWLMTGDASWHTRRPKPIKITKSTAHLSSHSFLRISLTTL